MFYIILRLKSLTNSWLFERISASEVGSNVVVLMRIAQKDCFFKMLRSTVLELGPTEKFQKLPGSFHVFWPLFLECQSSGLTQNVSFAQQADLVKIWEFCCIFLFQLALKIDYEALINCEKPYEGYFPVFTNILGTFIIYPSKTPTKMSPFVLIALFLLIAIINAMRTV